MATRRRSKALTGSSGMVRNTYSCGGRKYSCGGKLSKSKKKK